MHKKLEKSNPPISPNESDDLAAHVEKLRAELQALKSHLAANTQMTRANTSTNRQIADSMLAMQELIGKVDFVKLAELVGALDSMRGGIKVLGWLERPAKWIAAVGAAVAVVYSLWNQK
ncbi:MAG: hypothetical protein ABIT83_17585 [Massilia sp.]